MKPKPSRRNILNNALSTIRSIYDKLTDTKFKNAIDVFSTYNSGQVISNSKIRFINGDTDEVLIADWNIREYTDNPHDDTDSSEFYDKLDSFVKYCNCSAGFQNLYKITLGDEDWDEGYIKLQRRKRKVNM
jgi:hypothetical protein